MWGKCANLVNDSTSSATNGELRNEGGWWLSIDKASEERSCGWFLNKMPGHVYQERFDSGNTSLFYFFPFLPRKIWQWQHFFTLLLYFISLLSLLYFFFTLNPLYEGPTENRCGELGSLINIIIINIIIIIIIIVIINHASNQHHSWVIKID